jgi:hypothetical protein
MSSQYSDDDPVPALEVNEVGDELPGCIVPFPEECAHPECEKKPIVGVQKRFVCEDHLKWVLKPIRDFVRLVVDNTDG